MSAVRPSVGLGIPVAVANLPIRRRVITARTWSDIAVLLVLAILGIIGFEPSFGGYGFLLAGLGGLVLGAATGILTSLFRAGAVVTTLSAIIGYFLFGTALAVQSQAVFTVLPTVQSLASLAIGSVWGWADIVTLHPPIGAPQYIAVVPYISTWLVALVAVTLATRWLTNRPRTAWRFGVTLIGPIAIYLAGILIGTDQPYQAGIRGAAFAVIALAWLGWRRPNTAVIAPAGARRLRNRKLAGTAILLAGALVVGGGAGFVLAPANNERFVLRDEITPPFDPLQYPSPLSGFRHYTKQAEKDTLFTVTGLETGDTIRLATLDSFTGKLWTVTGPQSSTNGSGSFSLVGRSLPKQTFVTPENRRDITFTIDSYRDVWLPSVGYPTTLDFIGGVARGASDSLRYNDSTGTAVLTTGVVSGDKYVMNATVQKVLSTEELATASIATVELPPVVASPDIVTAKAQTFAGAAATPAAQLEAIRRALADTGYLSHGRASDTVASRAGHGADRINDLLKGRQMVGDQEQYASAFALMARSLNYPARVVMGFAPKIAAGQKSVAVTGNDVTAWVEVAFAGVGWVAFNSTPKETDVPQDQTPKPQSEPQPQVRQPPRTEKQADELLTPVSIDDSKSADRNAVFVIPGWVIALALVILIPLAVAFGPMLLIAAQKRRRRRRRREAAAGHEQVVGAWDELLDQFFELGYSVPPKTTRIHIARSLENQVVGSDPIRLGALATNTDRAVFSGQPVDEPAAAKAWTEVLAAAAIAKGTASRLRRVLSRYRIRGALRATRGLPTLMRRKKK